MAKESVTELGGDGGDHERLGALDGDLVDLLGVGARRTMDTSSHESGYEHPPS